MKMIKCPECHGEGSYHEGGPYLPPGGIDHPCELCKGSGIVSQKLRMAWVSSFRKIYGRRIMENV